MAIYHLTMKPVSRSSGLSAVAAAAYRAGAKLTNERDGVTHDYTRRSRGIAHAEIALPKGKNVSWARDRSKLWNAAERAENRIDARVAREFVVALPYELTSAERLKAIQAFAKALADGHGTAVDFAIHLPDRNGDIRNHHAHMLMTTRILTEFGLGEKTPIETQNKALIAAGLPTTDIQLRNLRQRWEVIANEHLVAAGLHIRIDHRSHNDRGLQIEPTEHMGVRATQMQRRGLNVQRVRVTRQVALNNIAKICENPADVLKLISEEKSVFNHQDVTRTIKRYTENAEDFRDAILKVMTSPQIVELENKMEGCVARYSTQGIVQVKRDMSATAGAASDRGATEATIGSLARISENFDPRSEVEQADSLEVSKSQFRRIAVEENLQEQTITTKFNR